MAENTDPTTEAKPKIEIPAEESLDMTGLLLDFLAAWKWFLLSVIVFLIGAYFYLATIVPTYKVNASIYMNHQELSKANATNFDPMSPLVNIKYFIDQTEIEILKSRNNVIKIVDSLGMSYTYWREGNFRDIPLYRNNAVKASMDSVSLHNLTSVISLEVSNGKEPETFDVKAITTVNGAPDEQDFENIALPYEIETAQGTVTLTRMSHVAELNGKLKIRIFNPSVAAGALSGSLMIEPVKDAPTIINISYFTPLISQGVDVINTLVDFYNQQIIEDQNRSAVQTEAFILERLVMINDELRDVEQRLQHYRESHRIISLEQQASSALADQTGVERQLNEIDAQLQILAVIEQSISQADQYSTIPAAVENQGLNSLIEAYNKKVGQLNRMLATSSADHPVVVQLQEDLTRDKSRMLQTLASVKSNINVRRKNISILDSRASSQISAIPSVDKGLQEIFREQQVKVNIYTFLLQRREEIALQKTLATPTARLIDNPSGSGPVSPVRSRIYMIALLLGLALPAAIIYVKRFFFPMYKDQEELQRLTNVPILGEIAADTARESKPIVVGQNVSTAIAELFRLLRNNIGFTRNGIDKKVILITSSVSGEGKTFIATNLAMTYALTGKKVVVVGMDIRRPVLAHAFGLSNQQGVTTFLSGQINDISSLIHQSAECENLYIMPAGPVPPNPNELLLSQNMHRLMDQLRHDFDYVILDTAPIGVISDSFLIIPHSDIQLYVTRASYSTKNSLKVLHQAIRDNRLSDPYIVLNGVDINAGSYYYRKYGHYTHSSSTYGYGYSSDVKTKKK